MCEKLHYIKIYIKQLHFVYCLTNLIPRVFHLPTLTPSGVGSRGVDCFT